MNLKITFDTEYQLIINLRDNDFVRRWVDFLEQELKYTFVLQEDTYSFRDTEEQAKHKLIQAIKVVNSFTKREFISIPSDEDFEKVDFYNTLHEKFEQLAGPSFDQPSKIMLIGPDKIRDSIRLINRYCHRLERRPYRQERQMRVEFCRCSRKSLTEEDLNLFEMPKQDNVVLLDYSTLGKSLVECFQDQLTPDYPGMKIQRHYSPNFIIRFKYEEGFPVEEFSDWLKKHGYENIPKGALGAIVLGEYNGLDAEKMIMQTTKIKSIEIERNNNG